MSDTESGTPARSTPQRWDSALTVFFLTVLAYIAAFNFEAGFLSHFGLYGDFVEVDLRELLIAGALVVALLSSVWLLSDAVAEWWSAVQARKAWSRLAWCIALSLYVAIAAWVTGAKWWVPVSLIFGVTAGTLAQFVIPLFIHRGGGSYLQRVEHAIEMGREYEGGGYRALTKRFGATPVAVVTALALTYGVASTLGAFTATFTDVFMVSETDPECVVIRANSSGMLCQVFDRSSHRLKPQFRFFGTEDKDRRLTLERLGRFERLDPAKLPKG